MTEPEKNEYGVTVIGEEDFTAWEWGDEVECPELIAKVACEAAKVVLDQITKEMSLDITASDGVASILGFIFECNIQFKRPLLDAIRQWIDEDREQEEIAHLIVEFEKAIGMLREAIR